MTDNNHLRQRRPSVVGGAKTAFGKLRVTSPDVEYTSNSIKSKYVYRESQISIDEASGTITATPVESEIWFSTNTARKRTGLLQVGWGGNNGTTVTGAVIANRTGIEWESRNGKHAANYHGALTQAATLRIGVDQDGKDVFVPFHSVVPMIKPDDFVLGGWDISGRNLADAMDAAKVFEPDLRRQLRPYLETMVPFPASFDADFIAKNQQPRADNLIQSKSKSDQLQQLRNDIARFKLKNGLEFAIVVWTANSERYSIESKGVNDTADNLLASIQASHPEVSPSTLYCVAAILEGCPYINGSPQNTFVPGVIELAHRHSVPICGDDFKSGQTKMKSVLADYLIGCGIKIKTMVTYNHLGNNDMYQLTDEVMWKPKSASKSRVIEDIVGANGLLYSQDDPGPDHVVVVKYVPFLGDSKRDVSEYTSEAFMDVHYTSIMHNECLDSALCAPLILDLAVFAELFSRVTFRTKNSDLGVEGKQLSPVLSVLGFYMKIPRTPVGECVVNALSRQKSCIENMLRALVGLAPESNLLLRTKCQ